MQLVLPSINENTRGQLSFTLSKVTVSLARGCQGKGNYDKRPLAAWRSCRSLEVKLIRKLRGGLLVPFERGSSSLEVPLMEVRQYAQYTCRSKIGPISTTPCRYAVFQPISVRCRNLCLVRTDRYGNIAERCI